ncbi:dTMP kinase [Oryzibacter oryziterrae]|uniref:dTMP kinase n=1 Tax=Oryzibacter oryziterrae TaxID=2766474 RepID=UPI001F013330|nr:dTMP kinase [Oryzibacter oryziterrae]
MARGKFITFEGGEGAGKSTQVRRLAEHLRALGLDVVVTREPGGSPSAEAIRGLLLSGRVRALGTLGEAYLFAAARMDHIAETIEPALERGAWVICDRFADSTRVYQGAADGLDVEIVDDLERIAVGNCRPDLTIVIDLPVDVGLARVAGRSGNGTGDRFEAEAVAVHEARRQGFLGVAAANPDRCVVIDGAREADAVTSDIAALVTGRFGLAIGGRA